MTKVRQGLHRIRIDAKPDGTARIELDGEDVSDACTGYSIEQEAGGYARVELRHVYWGAAEISGTVQMAEDGFLPREMQETVHGPFTEETT